MTNTYKCEYTLTERRTLLPVRPIMKKFYTITTARPSLALSKIGKQVNNTAPKGYIWILTECEEV